ncbi:hypothetical protein [Streptomyces sp. NPDC049881]|uniref:hypothetical protein n=1 Tax=Streptomyces sp. NPDC049881 TaxID=3155778 RepID=UPI003418417B
MLTRVLTSLAAALSLGIAVPATADAAAPAGVYGCDGTLIDTIDHPYDGRVVATTYLYWDGTYNCAVAVKKGSYEGVRTRRDLLLFNNTGAQPRSDEDDGRYLYYAGPVKVYGRNACIATELTMWNTANYDIFLHRSPYDGYFHCG